MSGAGFRVQGVGFRVWGVGCGVWGVGCRVWGVGCGVWGVGCGVRGGVFRVAERRRERRRVRTASRLRSPPDPGTLLFTLSVSKVFVLEVNSPTNPSTYPSLLLMQKIV